MKKILVFAVVTLFSISVFAETVFEHNGVYYKKTSSTTACVIANPDGTKYSGDIVIAVTPQRGVFTTAIADSAFYYCKELTSIDLPTSIAVIGKESFCDCRLLKSIKLPNITNVPYAAFVNCKELESVDISNVTTIDEDAFYRCSSLKSISDLSNVKEIPRRAFDGCDSIKVINVPAKKKDYYIQRLPEELHSLIVEMAPVKKSKKKDKEELIEEEPPQDPIFDFKFKKVDWELNEENIEERREEIDFYGAIYVRGISENGDFDTRVIAGCDIADGLYDAMDVVEEFINVEWDKVEVYYTTDCNMYGLDDYDSKDLDEALGYVLSSFGAAYCNIYSYDINIPAICRIVWEDVSDLVMEAMGSCLTNKYASNIWQTTDYGDFDTDIDCDVDALIKYKKR